MDVDLSVVIPLYNQEKYITQCVESVRNQVVDHLQIIIVDDGSTDGSGIICDNFAKIDERISVIHQENRGLSEARIVGLMATQTNYVTFVDADDFITPNAYDEAIEYMKRGYDEIFYEISRYRDENNIKQEYHVVDEGIYDRKRIVQEVYPKLIWNFERNTPGIDCSLCNKIVKRDLLLQMYENLKDRRFYYGEDMAISYPMMLRIEKLAVVSKSYYMHRQRGEGSVSPYIASNRFFANVVDLFEYLRNAMNERTYDFSKQIDYMYIYSVGLKKRAYHDYEYLRDFLFPFDKVQSGRKIVLYGAGLVGNSYYDQLEKLSYCTKLVWVDRNAEYINDPRVAPVSRLDEAEIRSFDRIVIAIENRRVAEEVREYLISKGYSKDDIVI